MVVESYFRLHDLGNSQLVVFGEVDGELDVEILPSLFNNRYGIPRKFIWNRAVSTLRKSEVIMIHGFYTYVTLFCLIYGKRSSKYFLMPHGSLENYQRAKSRTLKFLFRSIFLVLGQKRDFTFVVASEQEVLPVRNQFPDFPIEIIGIGIEFQGKPSIRKKVASTLNLVCISRLTMKKRIDLCIGVVKLMRDQGIDVELHILGSGDTKLTSSLQELVRLHDLVQVIHFHGHLTRKAIQQILPQMHIFLLPSENENFAIAVAEAISDGLPTIVSNNVAMHTFVALNKTGIVISELSTESLKEAILKVYSDIEEYSKNAIESRLQLSWDEVIKTWEEILCK